MPDTPGQPVAQDYHFETYLAGGNRSGRIQSVTLPSQGKIAYSYRPWYFPTACSYLFDDNLDIDYQRYGIGTKKRIHPDGTTEGLWTYTNSLFPLASELVASGANCSRANYRRTEVKGPTVDGRYTKTRSFHAVTQGPRRPTAQDPISSWQISDVGLPYRKDIRIGESESDYLFLSNRTYDCQGSCSLVRSEYVRYAMEYRQCFADNVVQDPGDCFQINPVLVRRRTLFHDDPFEEVETDGSRTLSRSMTEPAIPA